jgi:hypothetical protein
MSVIAITAPEVGIVAPSFPIYGRWRHGADLVFIHFAALEARVTEI